MIEPKRKQNRASKQTRTSTKRRPMRERRASPPGRPRATPSARTRSPSTCRSLCASIHCFDIISGRCELTNENHLLVSRTTLTRISSDREMLIRDKQKRMNEYFRSPTTHSDSLTRRDRRGTIRETNRRSTAPNRLCATKQGKFEKLT